MAHFTVRLPGNIEADIYKGKIFKKSLSLLSLFKRGQKDAALTGYIAMVPVAGIDQKNEYHLARTATGAWAQAAEEPGLSIKIKGRWNAIEDDAITVAVKNAIDEYENIKGRGYENK